MKYGINKKQIDRLAKLCDVSTVWLYLILGGKKKPGLQLAVKLEEETGVPVKVWASGSSKKINAALKAAA